MKYEIEDNCCRSCSHWLSDFGDTGVCDARRREGYEEQTFAEQGCEEYRDSNIVSIWEG